MNRFLWSFYKAAGIAEVSTVGIFMGDKMLWGKRRDNGRWTNPGGHLDPGEDPKAGALREAFEESGIKLDKVTHLKSEKVVTPKGKTLMIHAYRADVPEGTKASMKNDPDLEVHRWHWVKTPLSKEILENLHSPKNVLLKALGMLDYSEAPAEKVAHQGEESKEIKDSEVDYFWGGFQKVARSHGFLEAAQAHKNNEHTGSSWAAPAAAGAAALGAYAFLRRGGGKNPLVKTLYREKKKDIPGWFGKKVDKLLYGADDIRYTHGGQAIPKKPEKIRGTVIHETGEDVLLHKGTKNNFGAVSEKAQARMEDKLRESKMINSVMPKAHAKTELAQVVSKGRGRANLEALHRKQRGKDYILKPRSGENSGVGGASFVTGKDVQRWLAGKKLPEGKRKALNRVLNDPSKFIAQGDLKILKDPLQGSRELRVHAFGGKVVPGATSIRGRNWRDMAKNKDAEAYFQKFLDKLPASAKGNTAWQPDIAVTKDGFKIVELNAGSSASGLLDPRYMGGKGVHHVVPALNAVKNNAAIYKHFTGRDAAVTAAGKAGLAGAGTYAGAKILGPKGENPQRT